MEFDKKVLDHTLHDWMDNIKNAVEFGRPGLYIICGVERQRQPILDSTLSVLEAFLSTFSMTVPSRVARKRFEAYSVFERMSDPDETEEAFHLARCRPVIAGMHTLGLRNSFRRLDGVGVRDWDLEVIRGVYCATGLRNENGDEVTLKDIRFFGNEEAVMKEKVDEFKYSSDRYFVGDALRRISNGGITIDDIKKRFEHGDRIDVDIIQSLCAD
ncbi:hypothetical protein D3C71_152790 [compost metagenome]